MRWPEPTMSHAFLRASAGPGRFDGGRGANMFKRNAKDVIRIIRELSDAERQRLGMELARQDILKPHWRVLRRRDSAEISRQGLTGMQARLFEYIDEAKEKTRRERNVIYHLWPADAAKSADVTRDVTLKGRLRKLQCDTNRNLRLLNLGCQIRRRSSGHHLHISEDEN
jgi:hypothetical protein